MKRKSIFPSHPAGLSEPKSCVLPTSNVLTAPVSPALLATLPEPADNSPPVVLDPPLLELVELPLVSDVS